MQSSSGMTPEEPRSYPRDPERLERLLETAELGDWELDPETLAANCSDRHFAIFGYQRDESPVWSLERFLSHVIPADSDRVSETIRDGLERQTGWSFECRINGADLIEKWISVSARFFSEEGKQRRVLGVVADISRRKALEVDERKLAENTLRQSEQQWVAVFENLREGLVLSDLEGKLLYWNRSGLAMCGYNHLAEGLAPRVEHAQTFEISELDGRLLALEEWPLSRVLRGEVLENQELCFRRVDRGWEKVFAYSGAVIQEAGGRPIAFLAMRDITDRKLAEVALRESERRFRETLDSMMEGCQIIGRDWRYLYVNEAAARHGKREAAELLGRTMMECYPGIEEGEIFRALGRAMQSGPPEELENEFLYPDGTSGTFQLYIQAVQEGVFVLSLDVSQRKEAERQMQSLNLLLERRVWERTQQLEIANQELEAFSYSVSHDLRTPLRAIEGFSRVLSQNFAPHLPDDGQRYLKGVRKASQQMALLIDDLLRFSQVTRHELQLRSVHTSALVVEVLEDLVGDSGAAEVFVEELPDCRADLGLLRQVWSNLLSNALKYSRQRPSPKIHVGARVEGAEVIYFVADNGSGFDMRYAAKLFGVFQRLHRAEEFEGTGVGLALVERIIRRHGGQVWAESRLDQGATFFFKLSD